MLSLAKRAVLGRSFSTIAPPLSKYFDRRTVDFCLFNLPSVIKTALSAADRGVDESTISLTLNSAESFVSSWAAVDPLLDRVENEPRFDPSLGRVIMPQQSKELLSAYAAAGFNALHDGEMPHVAACAAELIMAGAFTSGVLGHSVLTGCAAKLLKLHGDKELVDVYHQPMVEGRWAGTMALSETQAGSSLQDIATKAVKASAGRPGEYRIKGKKMWTSGCDQNFSENIIHMLLAKTEDGKISLFLVPSSLVVEDESNPSQHKIGRRNNISIGGLNHKMGHRGISNCYWQLGEDGDGAVGYLVGQEGKGLQAMMAMMNDMRVHVGLGACASGMRGYLESLTYAIERRQGRIAGKGGAKGPQVPIIEHEDVRRMLLAQKAYSEGSLCLVLYAASLVDSSKTSESDRLLLDLITPIVKSYPSEWCLEANKWAIQILGGYGYTRDFPLEQIYRDNRLNMIHEGTAGIHALTFAGRNISFSGGRAFADLLSRIRSGARGAPDADSSARLLRGALVLEKCARALTKDEATRQGPPRNAHEMLNISGTVLVAWLHCEMAAEATKMLGDRSGVARGMSDDFLRGKIAAAEYFLKFELEKVEGWGKVVEGLDDTVTRTKAEWL